MSVCLLPDQIENFKKALKDRDLDVLSLLKGDMDTAKLTEAFKPYAGENAANVAKLFEQKMILKNRAAGIKNLLSQLMQTGKYSDTGLGEKAMNEYLEKQVKDERIFSPDENESFLNTLADKLTGTHVSREVAGKVFELSQKAEALKDTNPTMSGVSDEYLQAKQDLDQYVRSQHPVTVSAAILKDIAIIARNNLLLNPSTPVKTTIGQTLNSAIDMVTRRIGLLSSKGDNYALVKQANAEAWTTFKKTGQNTTAMESLEDTHNSLGEKGNFEMPADATVGSKIARKAANVIGKVARVSQKVAITYEHQYSFTKFHQKAFFDMANLLSSKMAEGDVAKSAEIFKDAARIEPQTELGALVRQQSQIQAARITSTNRTWVSDMALNAKNVLNKYGEQYGGLPVGDLLIPIAKIPANIIWNGIENAGAGIPAAVKDIFQGRQKIQSTDLSVRYEGMAQYANGIQKAARIAGTMGAAYLFAQSIPKQNFKQDQYGTTYVKIGNIWVNAEYFSAISPALAGFMSVRAGSSKKPDLQGSISNYVVGATKPLAGDMPGISDALQIFQNPGKYAQNFFDSRGVPAFIPNLFKDRTIDRLFFGAHGIETQQDVNKDKAKNPKAVI